MSTKAVNFYSISPPELKSLNHWATRQRSRGSKYSGIYGLYPNNRDKGILAPGQGHELRSIPLNSLTSFNLLLSSAPWRGDSMLSGNLDNDWSCCLLLCSHWICQLGDLYSEPVKGISEVYQWFHLYNRWSKGRKSLIDTWIEKKKRRKGIKNK